MAGTSFGVNTDELVSWASQVDTMNDELYALLQNIKNEMNELGQTYSSNASRTIIQSMNNKEKAFVEYKAVVAEYANFMRRSAEKYNVADETMDQYAKTFL